ncbi:MAG: 3-oxoacyl-ACP synthase [Bacteroidales bacterium]|nr:3-oxoacyl-ACP synthase [Bacteroidales bacterium]
MTNKHIYINGLGNVSPQKTTDSGHFLQEPFFFETNQLKCIDPGFKQYIPSDLFRRMGRIIKMGITAAKICLQDAKQCNPDGTFLSPDAIVTGTGLGCIEDTEKFLTNMIRNKEEFLTPTSFIQSTHNTVAGQIALLLKCHGHNFTFVHRGFSFESALLDAITQINMEEFSNALVGGTDELTQNSFAITSRLGHWKRKPINTQDLLLDRQRGSIAGEGASFVFLENTKNSGTYAELKGVLMVLNPSSTCELSEKVKAFLELHNLSERNVDLLLLGLNGDSMKDRVYHELVEKCFQNTSLGFFKHLCGEYQTVSSFALWLASMIMKTQNIPTPVRLNHVPEKIRHILIYNHYQAINHSFILISHP